LDEVGAACPEGKGSRARLEQTYRKVTAEVGERLASSDDQDSFSPRRRGVILDIEYDTAARTWRMPEPKFSRLLGQVNAMVIKCEAAVQEELVGLNVLQVLSGRFNANYIIKPELEEEDFGDGSWKTARSVGCC
jgi:hypothetical protein